LRELLQNAEILDAKDLLNLAQKQLDKAEKLAMQYEKYDFLTQISSFRMGIVMRQGDLGLEKMEQTLEQVFGQMRHYLHIYQNLNDYKELALRMLMLNRREQQIVTDEGRQRYDQIFENPLLGDSKLAESNRALLFCHQSRFIYHFADGDFPQSYVAASELVKLLESKPELLDERPENYVNSQQNLIMVSTLCQPPEVSLALIEHLKHFRSILPKVHFGRDLEEKVMLFAINLELQILTEGGQLDKAADRLPEALQFLENHQAKFNLNDGFVLVALRFKAARLALHLKKHSLALKQLNILLNDNRIGPEFEVFVNAKLLQVMVLFDAGEAQVLESAMLSLYRILQKRKQLKKFDKVLLLNLRKLSDFPEGSNLKPWFAQLVAELRKILDSQEEGPTMQQRDIFAWLEAKVAEGM
jgi:hypothetical protein